jgi:hypothetical protein
MRCIADARRGYTYQLRSAVTAVMSLILASSLHAAGETRLAGQHSPSCRARASASQVFRGHRGGTGRGCVHDPRNRSEVIALFAQPDRLRLAPLRRSGAAGSHFRSSERGCALWRLEPYKILGALPGYCDYGRCLVSGSGCN